MIVLYISSTGAKEPETRVITGAYFRQTYGITGYEKSVQLIYTQDFNPRIFNKLTKITPESEFKMIKTCTKDPACSIQNLTLNTIEFLTNLTNLLN